ncbi:tyrosine-protein phosphatase [Methylocystis sp.]|uniref:tyrosine-protein phosphatase n=1 Tax=Methylocystis sp. TaxID=1911079 RepID=UPI003D0E4649
MIDLHSHILPGIDDGAADLNIALEMARVAVANGVTVQACTPHIFPGVYDNSGPQIRLAVDEFQKCLDEHGIPLRLVTGADAHIVPNMAEGLRSGAILSLADTRYVLVEPPHHVAPPRIEYLFFELLTAGYVPILTHPERLTWIESRFDTFVQLFHAGVWMQVTSGSVTGSFGRRPQYWSERLLNEGMVHILASDAHGARRRRPDLAQGRTAAAKWVGESEAEQLVLVRPRAILENVAPSDVNPPARAHDSNSSARHGLEGRSSGHRSRGRGIRRNSGSEENPRHGADRGFSGLLNRLFG